MKPSAISPESSFDTAPVGSRDSSPETLTSHLHMPPGTRLASDLLPLCDLLGLAVVAMSMHSLGLLHDLFGGNTQSLTQAGSGAALAAPFILYDRQFGQSASRGRTAAWLFSFGPRFVALVALTAVLVHFAAPLVSLAPQAVLAGLLLALLVTLLPRVLLAAWLRHLQQNGQLRLAVAVVGAGPQADRLVQTWRCQRSHAIDVVGVFDERRGANLPPACDLAGDLDRLAHLAHLQRIDWVLLALPGMAPGRLDQLQPLLQRLAALAVPVGLCPLTGELDVPVAPARPVAYLGDGLAVDLLVDHPMRRRDVVAKRALDLVGSVTLIVLLLPLWIAIALAIRLDSAGPLIFRQRRHAVNGREFDIFKFRTMRWNPPTPAAPAGASAGAAPLRDAQVLAGMQQTVRGDPRITRMGNFLRQSSLDELPQLFNVLRGEMSLVGPRPHAIDMRTENRLGSEITDTYVHRQRVKPGITGWAQVNGARGATDTTLQLRRRVELDLYYIDHWSLLLDLRILVLTVREVIRRTNAY